MNTIEDVTPGAGSPVTLAEQLHRVARRLHGGEEVTGRAVDVMIEAAETLRSLTTVEPITVSALAEGSVRSMESTP